MLVIKKRSKLTKSLLAGVGMFTVGLTGSVAYLDATTPSMSPVYTYGMAAVPEQSDLSDQTSGGKSLATEQPAAATSSSRGQTDNKAPLASHSSPPPSQSATGTDAVSSGALSPADSTQPRQPSFFDGLISLLP